MIGYFFVFTNLKKHPMLQRNIQISFKYEKIQRSPKVDGASMNNFQKMLFFFYFWVMDWA